MIHQLKLNEEFFGDVITGKKNFEVRKNDRNYKVGDYLKLLSYDPQKGLYTGGEAIRKITYILHGGQFGIEKGFVVIGMQ